MTSHLFLLFTLMCAVTNSFSQAGESLEARIVAKKWQRRVILIYARNAKNPDLLAQKRMLAEQEKGLHERDFDQIVVLESDLSATDRTYLRGGDRQLAPTVDFTTYLIGKDGGVKQRFSRPVATAELFRLVDAMPMRQRERKPND